MDIAQVRNLKAMGFLSDRAGMIILFVPGPELAVWHELQVILEANGSFKNVLRPAVGSLPAIDVGSVRSSRWFGLG